MPVLSLNAWYYNSDHVFITVGNRKPQINPLYITIWLYRSTYTWNVTYYKNTNTSGNIILNSASTSQLLSGDESEFTLLGPGRKLVYYPPEIDEKSTGSVTGSESDPDPSTDVFRFEMSFIFPKYQQHVDMLYFESRQRDVEWNMNVKVGDNVTLRWVFELILAISCSHPIKSSQS